MQYQFSTIALAAMLLASASAQAQTSDDQIFSFSGFGTIGAVHSSEKQADFNASAQQPDGAGRSDSISYSVDSRLGAQLSANMGNGVSAVLQVISEQRADGSWKPTVEWANVKYAFNEDFSVRVGRIALPVLLYSNSRKVGITNPMVRAPVETYRNSIMSSNDGVDVTYRAHFGSVTNTTTLLYGKKDVDLPAVGTPSGTTGLELKDTIGITSALEFGDTMLRASYGKTDVTVESLLPLLATGVPMLMEIGKLGDNQPAKSYSVAGTYDPGNWFVVGEAATLESKVGGKMRSCYVIGGYRMGTVTPYAAWSANDLVEASGLPGSLSSEQKTLSAGVRWDFIKGAALKVQADRVSLGAQSGGSFTNHTPAFRPGGHANVATVVVDFMF